MEILVGRDCWALRLLASGVNGEWKMTESADGARRVSDATVGISGGR